MDYRIEKKDTFKVIAKVKSFSNDDKIYNVELPNFWTECFSDGSITTLSKLADKIQCVVGNGTLGICDGDSLAYGSEQFNYAIGVETNKSEAPERYTIIEIPSTTWAIFKCIGAMPDAIQNMSKSYIDLIYFLLYHF